MESYRRWLHPKEAFKMFELELPEWIIVNPNLNKRTGAQYEIIRQTTSDGTMIFEIELISNTIENLYNKTSFFKNEPITDEIKDIKYEIGLISIATIFGIVKLPAGKFPGQKQRTRLPVKCILIK